MKKTISLFLILLLFLFVLSSCDANEVGGEVTKVVCLSFPEYDWVRNIIGEESDIQLTLLRRSGIDIHSYQPTAADLMDIYESDLFIYVASPSFAGFDDAVNRSNGKTLDLLAFVGEEEHHGHEHEHDHATDEHIWLSLGHASECCERIAKALAELDSVNAQSYYANAEAYITELSALDSEYREAVKNANTNILVFADRYPFTHMAHDYSLECYAAFSGCSGESGASYETFDYLISKVDEYSLDCVLTVEGSDGKIARTVASSAETKDQKILTLNSMQALGGDDAKKGVTYLSVMRENLEVLKEALG